MIARHYQLFWHHFTSDLFPLLWYTSWYAHYQFDTCLTPLWMLTALYDFLELNCIEHHIQYHWFLFVIVISSICTLVLTACWSGPALFRYTNITLLSLLILLAYTTYILVLRCLPLWYRFSKPFSECSWATRYVIQNVGWQFVPVLNGPIHKWVFMCFAFISEQTATCATYSINWLVFITEMKSVYCAVRIGFLNKAICSLYLT